MPSSRAVTLTLTRSYKINSSAFWHISFEDMPPLVNLKVNRLQSIPYPASLKLLEPKLYLVEGKWNVIIYSIHLFVDFLDFFPSFVRNFIMERSSKSLVFIVDPHPIVLEILTLSALTSDWFAIVAATCQDMSGTNTREELIRAIGRSMRNINKEARADAVRRLPNIWQKEINKGGVYIQGK